VLLLSLAWWPLPSNSSIFFSWEFICGTTGVDNRNFLSACVADDPKYVATCVLLATTWGQPLD
jgi:hypothetical protein